jgi:L-2-hydroxyglutarate oxidase LhgO
MALEGNKRAREYCQEHGVAYEKCGTLVVARNPKEEQILENMLHMGNEAGVEGLEIVDETELKRREPKVRGYKALISPNGAIVDSKGFLEAVASEANEKGAQFVMGAKVTDIKDSTIITSQGNFKADYIINCAGLYADKIAHMMGVGLDYEIIPFRGEYMEIRNGEINSMVYQTPDLRYPFLGVHLTKTIDGRVLAGPTAILSFGRESYEKEVNLREIIGMASTLNRPIL